MQNVQPVDSGNQSSHTMAGIHTNDNEIALLQRVYDIYDKNLIIEALQRTSGNDWSRPAILRKLKGYATAPAFNSDEMQTLRDMLPSKPQHAEQQFFRFIDLFAGIGGIRSGFEAIGGKCVFTSEWNSFSTRTYKANWHCDEHEHTFNSDIREITLSDQKEIAAEQAYAHIDQNLPDHDVLLAGFPCQPFSLAGVSKKNSLGRAHGFACETQGTLFFDVARIIKAKKPAIFVLENVKNLKSHDKGNTFRIIMETLDELGYDVADAGANGPRDPKIIDGQNFLPQHRERIVLVGFRRDLKLAEGFSLSEIEREYPSEKITLRELIDEKVDEKYILTPKLWNYLYNYAKKHQSKGNGFGYGLIKPFAKNNEYQQDKDVCRALSARYSKDGSEILIDRGFDMRLAESDFFNPDNISLRPRRLTPRECARIMGFELPGKINFRIPVSDTQAYRQFGNSVIVPMFAAVARMLESRIRQAVEMQVIREECPNETTEHSGELVL